MNSSTNQTNIEQRTREIAPHLLEEFRRQRIVVRQNDRREWEAVLFTGNVEGSRVVAGRATRDEVVAVVRERLASGALLGTLEDDAR